MLLIILITLIGCKPSLAKIATDPAIFGLDYLENERNIKSFVRKYRIKKNGKFVLEESVVEKQGNLFQ